MSYRSLVIGIAIFATSARASAQDDAPVKPTKKHAKADKGGDADQAQWADDAKTPEPSDTDEIPPKAKPAEASEPAPPPPAAYAPEPLELGPAPDRPPVYGKRTDWFMVPYGYARLDAIEDSTQSFADGIQPNLIQRAGTYAGDHQRTVITARDSRLGLFVGPPEYRGIRTSGQIEFDFYGLEPTDARIHDSVVFATPRLRLAYLKIETRILDVVAGQYYDLFGWNGSYYVATVGYLGIPGEVYHRNPQLRLEKTLRFGNLELTAAAALVRPGQRDSGVPEGQAGLKIAYRGWLGAAMAGFGRPQLQPLSLGVSALYRKFQVPVFRAQPGSESQEVYGRGLAAQLLLPVIPVKTLKNRVSLFFRTRAARRPPSFIRPTSIRAS
jgi:hypothetical protein